jgi:type VI secretion system secreted protein VgrG
VVAKGIKLFAGKGDIAIQAQVGSLELVGEKETKLIACHQGIDLAAPDRAVLSAGGCQVTLEGGSITLTAPRNVNCKAKWNVVMPMAKTYEMPDLRKVDEVHDRHFKVVDLDTGEPLPYSRYELTTDSGKKIKGITDANGYTGKVAAHAQEGAEINVFMDEEEG